MLKSVRKKVLKKSIIKIIVCLVIIVGLNVVFQMEPIKYLKGTQKVDSNNMEVDKLDRKYIETDLYAAFDTGIKEVTTTTKNNDKTSTETTGKYYVVMYNEANMMCFVLASEKSDIKLLDELVSSTSNGTDSAGVHVKGSFNKFRSEEVSSLVKYMNKAGIEQQYYPSYILRLGYVGNVKEANILVSYVIMILALLYAILSAYKGFSNRYLKDIKKFANSINYDLDRLVQELEASPCVDGVWVTERFTAYISGSKCKVIENKSYVWAYYYEYKRTRKGVTTVSNQLKLHTKDKDVVTIILSCEEEANVILNRYLETQPQMVIGYTKELNKLFKKNIDEFLKIPYEQDSVNVEEQAEEVE